VIIVIILCNKIYVYVDNFSIHDYAV